MVAVFKFNTKKCSIIAWCYKLYNSNISRCDRLVVDLGLKFNSILDPRRHININCFTAYKMLGLINKPAHDFKLGSL